MGTAAENSAWLTHKVSEAGLTEELYAAAVAVLLAGAPWNVRFSRAYEHAHNVRRLTGAQIARFARAYADVTEDQPMTMGAFWVIWSAGGCSPDILGTYHRIGPWAA